MKRDIIKINILKDNKCKDFALLKCTSTYPASTKNSNILTIPHMMNLLNCNVGLSDHTLGIGAAIAAVSHGACLIEKHFTLSRDDGGVDADFSLEPKEFKLLRDESERAWEALGSIRYGASDAETNASKKRRSIYVSKDISAGDTLSKDNLKIVRPGLGLSPKMIDIVVGRKVSENIKKGTALSWKLIK